MRAKDVCGWEAVIHGAGTGRGVSHGVQGTTRPLVTFTISCPRFRGGKKSQICLSRIKSIQKKYLEKLFYLVNAQIKCHLKGKVFFSHIIHMGKG